MTTLGRAGVALGVAAGVLAALVVAGVRREVRSDGVVETRPDGPGHNPAAFVEIEPIAKVYQREPRVETWARPVEAYLSDRIGKELPSLLRGVRLAKVECRTACCRVDLEQDQRSSDALNPVMVQQMLAVLYAPAAGGQAGPGLSFILAYRGETSWLKDVPGDDPTALFAAIERRRAFLLRDLEAKAAAGQSTPYPMIDPRTLPER